MLHVGSFCETMPIGGQRCTSTVALAQDTFPDGELRVCYVLWIENG